MNHKEATTVVRQELMKYRRTPYVELRRLVDTRLPTLVIKGASGAEYQVVIRVQWEGERGGTSASSVSLTTVDGAGSSRFEKTSSRVPTTLFRRRGSQRAGARDAVRDELLS
jgi:hypothetical protein